IMLPVRVAPPTRPPTAHQRPPTRGGKVTCVMCHTKRVLLGFLHVACDLWPFHAGFLHRQPPTPRHHSLTRGPLGVHVSHQEAFIGFLACCVRLMAIPCGFFTSTTTNAKAPLTNAGTPRCAVPK